MIEYPFTRATAINGDKLDGEIKTVLASLSYRTEPGRVIVIAEAALSQPVIDALAAVVTNHDPSDTPAQTEALANTAALTLLKANNANRMQYFPYFVHLQDVCLTHIANQTAEATRFSETLAALKQNKASNPDHAFMFQRFLYETGIKNGVANMTESILDNLTVAQRRTFYNEVQVFYTQGLLAGLSVMLKNGN